MENVRKYVLRKRYHTGIFIVLPFQIHLTRGVNLGLFAGDAKRNGGPVVIKKYLHKSPVIVNIHTNPLVSPLPRSKLPAKPPPIKLSDSFRSLSPLKKPFFLWPGTILPLLPKLPLLPTALKPVPPYSPILPIIPKIAVLPTPIIPSLLPKRLPFQPSHLTPLIAPIHPLSYVSTPYIPKFSRAPKISLKPMKVYNLGKRSLLQNVLGAEIRTMTLPYRIIKRRKNVLEKFLKFNKIGCLMLNS